MTKPTPRRRAVCKCGHVSGSHYVGYSRWIGYSIGMCTAPCTCPHYLPRTRRPRR